MGRILADIAFARSGDKGDISNIGVIAKDRASFEELKSILTPERIKAHFKDWVKGDVLVYEMPNIESFNVICKQALGGGATRTLRFDQTGKAMSTALLRMPIG
ncbi:MAG: hypothetical protein WCP95_12755 [Actinomycetes bacterium]